MFFRAVGKKIPKRAKSRRNARFCAKDGALRPQYLVPLFRYDHKNAKIAQKSAAKTEKGLTFCGQLLYNMSLLGRMRIFSRGITPP